MALATATATASTCSCSSQLLPRPKFSTLPFPIPFANPSRYRRLSISFAAAAAAKKDSNAIQSQDSHKKKKKKKKQVEVEEEEEVEEVEEELPWLQEKALDVVEFTGSVTQAIPGPRVGTSSLPWILALPLAYAGLTFVIAFVKTVKKLSSPREKRRKLVNKNAFLCKSIDQQLHSLTPDALKALEKKTGFGMQEILRKYIRYALNEKPFNPDLVAHLIHLRKASMLDDSQVASILNDISARIVRDKGPVVMDMSGYSEKGFKRKLAVQALFGKVFYLSELPEFCSRDSSLVVKEIFGVTDDDADKLRIHTLSEAGDMDSLEKMVDGSDSEDSSEESPSAS
uniref:Armadillo-like repeats domain-containing protein n=2 Tax=Quercus lobata TaxID=97700 RepID=A0A7N2KK30_QUELO